MKKALGLLLTNIGTPDSPSVTEVRRYLKAFLADPRVVRIPRILWLPLLHLLVLPLRASFSAKLYQNIWTPEGSPLKLTMVDLRAKLETYLSVKLAHPVFVETGMHYGSPSISEALEKLQAHNIQQLLVLPLFPQYSTSTTETSKDQVKRALKKLPALTPLFNAHYTDHLPYIAAMVQHIKTYHDRKRYLLFSFHGLPQHFVAQGDPYAELCQRTASAIAKALALPEDRWSLAYQSRFGYAKWLAPYTFEVLKELPSKGAHELAIVCPGFAVDCLETLEEIQIRGKETFLKHGGKTFQYIPALNASTAHIEALGAIVEEMLQRSKI